jgi:hypothetical protein
MIPKSVQRFSDKIMRKPKVDRRYFTVMVIFSLITAGLCGM